MSTEDLRTAIEAACTEQGKAGWSVTDFKLDGLPTAESKEARSVAMTAMDKTLGKILEEERGDDYTVIYFSSPHEASLRNYESEFVVEPAVAPMELKRRAAEIVEGVGRRADAGNSSSAPLFVKYQFFTPGKFSPSFVFGPKIRQLDLAGADGKSLYFVKVFSWPLSALSSW